MQTRYINERQVEEIYGLKIKSLQRDRQKKQGINYHKIGKRVLYDRLDVEEYLLKNKVKHS